MIVPFAHVLLFAAVLFVMGLGCTLARRNLIMILIGVEIMLNAAGLADPDPDAGQEQLDEILGRAAQRRTDQEDGDADQVQLAPAAQVRKPAPHRHRRCGGEEIRAEDPAIVLETAEPRDDRQQGGL